MADDNYNVKINRRDGVVEITGTDKAWIAEQLDKLSVVYTDEPPAGVETDSPASEGDSGTSTRKPRRRPTAKKKGGTKTKAKAASEVPEKLTEAMQKKLEQFKEARKDHFKSRQDQAAIIATFLEDEMKLEGTSSQDLAAVYEIMGWRAPVNARAVINNARDRNNYFRGWSKGRAPLSVTGKNFGRIDSKKAKSEAS
jgi:DNA-binding protein H-NS